MDTTIPESERFGQTYFTVDDILDAFDLEDSDGMRAAVREELMRVNNDLMERLTERGWNFLADTIRWSRIQQEVQGKPYIGNH